MEYADLISKLGQQQQQQPSAAGFSVKDGVLPAMHQQQQPASSGNAAFARANKMDHLKTLVHSYKKKLSVKNTALSANKWLQGGFTTSGSAAAAAAVTSAAALVRASKNKLVIENEPAFETLNRAGRSILYKREVFTEEEAKLFILGDATVSRLGLIHLCGVDDFDLRSSALVLLDDLILNEEIQHPSRDTFKAIFDEIDHKQLCKELCLDLHVLRPRTRYTAFRLADAIPTTADLLMRNNKQALNLYFEYARANEQGVVEDENGNVLSVDAAFAAQVQAMERPNDGLPTTWNELGVWSLQEEEEELAKTAAEALARVKDEAMVDDASAAASLYIVDPLGLNVNGRVSREDAPEQVLRSMYSGATRDDLLRAVTNLNKDLQVKRLQERKLVHDRLSEFIKIRESLEALARTLHDGIAVAKSAQHSLSLAKEVADVHVAPLLARERRKTRAKEALELVRAPSSKFVFNAAEQLDRLTLERDFARGLEVIEKIQVEESLLGSGADAFPVVFQRAKERNFAAMTKFVDVLQREILSSEVERQVLAVFIRVKQRFVSIADGEVVLQLHEIKAGQVKQVFADMLRSNRYMDLSFRASKIVSELVSHFERDFPQPSSIPPGLLIKYEAAIVALERYALHALEVMERVTSVCMDYAAWTKRLVLASSSSSTTALSSSNAVLDTAPVMDLGRDVLHKVLIESAPPLVPLDCHIVLSLARDLELLWRPSNVLFPQPSPLQSPHATATSSSINSSTRHSESSASSMPYSAMSTATGSRFVLWRTAGVLQAVLRLNQVGQGMESFAKTVTGEILNLALDELQALMEGVNRSVTLMRLDVLLPADLFSKEGDVFLAPLLEFCWQQIYFCLDQVMRPLLESTKAARVELVKTLSVQDRFTKSVRVLGTIMGKCAELSRLSRKGFLILTRDCQLLTSKRIRMLDFHCGVEELQSQFERLEPALATQYLKACVTTCSDCIPEALESDPGEDGGVSDVWMLLLHDLSEFVNECESFIGSRYAKKLQSGLAMFLAAQICELVQKQLPKLSPARCKQVELDLTFFGIVLGLQDANFLALVKSLGDKSRWKNADKQKAVERECGRHAWLVSSFVW